MKRPAASPACLMATRRFALALAVSIGLHGGALLAFVRWTASASVPLSTLAVEVVDIPQSVPRPVPSVDQSVAAALRTALDLPGETADAPHPMPQNAQEKAAPAVSWPKIPVRIKPPRLETSVAASVRAPDAPPPIPAGAPVNLERGLRTAAAPPASAFEPARAHRGNEAPAYPDDARRKGLQGQVLLRVSVTVDGRPETVTLVESSGWAVLDDAAMIAVERWRFDPARRNGRPEPATIELPIVFRLDGG